MRYISYTILLCLFIAGCDGELGDGKPRPDPTKEVQPSHFVLINALPVWEVVNGSRDPGQRCSRFEWHITYQLRYHKPASEVGTEPAPSGVPIECFYIDKYCQFPENPFQNFFRFSGTFTDPCPPCGIFGGWPISGKRAQDRKLVKTGANGMFLVEVGVQRSNGLLSYNDALEGFVLKFGRPPNRGGPVYGGFTVRMRTWDTASAQEMLDWSYVNDSPNVIQMGTDVERGESNCNRDDPDYSVMPCGCRNNFRYLPPVEVPCGAYGDFDGDGDVDGVDFGFFASCFNGTGNPYVSVECSVVDRNADGSVDGADFGTFAGCFNGTGNKGACW